MQRRVLDMLGNGLVSVEQARRLLALNVDEDALDDQTVLDPEADVERVVEPGVEPTIGPLKEVFDLERIDADLLDELDGLGFSNLSAEHLLELRLHDIDLAWVAALQAAGLHNLSVEEWIQLSVHGVDADFVRAVCQAGLKPDVAQLIEIKQRLG
ncbi:MAG: hypothetical protein RMN25_06380 [Anaerolineae bacterium]|nr:hypothetical protein [Thermoflexales bacterium]MDW8407395.1 hypothetical protein [Anaerolineae bacterium]